GSAGTKRQNGALAPSPGRDVGFASVTPLLGLAKYCLAGGLVSDIAATSDKMPPPKPAQNGIKPPSRLAVSRHRTAPKPAIKHSTTITVCRVLTDRRDIRLPSQAFAPARAAVTPDAPKAKAESCTKGEPPGVADLAENARSMATTHIKPQIEA